MSPWVATTRFSLVATITLQPVPQKRHGALSHLSSVAARSVTRFAASAGVAIPPAAAAIAAASSLRTWRRSSFAVVMIVFSRASARIDGVKDEGGREHVRQQRNRIERRPQGARVRGFEHDHKLALGIA